MKKRRAESVKIFTWGHLDAIAWLWMDLVRSVTESHHTYHRSAFRIFICFHLIIPTNSNLMKRTDCFCVYLASIQTLRVPEY